MSVIIKTVNIPSGTVRCAVFGSGKQPLVILPGLGVKSVIDSAEEVAAAYKVFNDTHTVYLIDRRTNLPEGVTIDEIAEDTAEAVKALDIEGADVFATSFGGKVAQLLAVNHPELVSKLVFGSTAPCINPQSAKVINNWVSLARERKREELCRDFVHRVYSAQIAEKFCDFLVSRMSDCTDYDLDQLVFTAESAKNFDIRPGLCEIKCPVLVIGAENDGVLTGEASREIADILGCELYMYGEPYNHAVYDEAPDYKEKLLHFYSR